MNLGILRSALTGNYQTTGDVQSADCIVAQSFGAAENGPGHVNTLLAQFIIDHTNGTLPLIAQQEVAESIHGEAEIALTVTGSPSTTTGGELDSWTVLSRAREYMANHDLNRPLLVAQAHHVGRVAAQARLQGMEPIIPAELPRSFDPNSTQPWTRNSVLWGLRESLGLVVLKATDRL